MNKTIKLYPQDAIDWDFYVAILWQIKSLTDSDGYIEKIIQEGRLLGLLYSAFPSVKDKKINGVKLVPDWFGESHLEVEIHEYKI